MITALGDLDAKIAAGVLARAALALEDDANPAAAPQLSTEVMLRDQIFEELRTRHDLGQGEISTDTRALLSAELDQESDRLLGPINSPNALERLALTGDLPTDLYEIEIIGNVQQFYGQRFEFEKTLIEDAIKHPDLTQHYGPASAGPSAPALISLFAKSISDKYPARSFIVLVAAQRQHMRLIVQQAWRVYPEAVDLRGVDSLIEMLRRFASAFGAPVTFGSHTGSFILMAELPLGTKPPEHIVWERKSKEITVSYFWQRYEPTGQPRASLVVAIDLNKYHASLKRFGWGREEFLHRGVIFLGNHILPSAGTYSYQVSTSGTSLTHVGPTPEKLEFGGDESA